jgi:hypothetical protein
MVEETDIRPVFRLLRSGLPAVALLLLGSAIAAHAGPPFLTDDPDPVDLNHWEF